MNINIFVKDGKDKAKKSVKRKGTKAKKVETLKVPQADKQKSRRAYWANRKAQEKKAANLGGGENNESNE